MILWKMFLSHDVAVIGWITSCHKNHTSRHVYFLTLWRVDVTSLTMSVSTMRFLLEILPILKAIKSHFKGSYDTYDMKEMGRPP